MNREQKSATIDEIAGQISEAEAIFAVDYRGITVAQIAELRTRLREADASFRVVKNSLTERAADKAGAEVLKDYLAGPTALAFVRGDIATAAKAVADYGRSTQLLPFKGGLMNGAALDVEQIRSLSRLPSRDVLYGQLVGVVSSPIGGLVRSLSALLGGLAVALGQVREKKESGELPAGEAPAEAEAAAEPTGEAPAEAEAAAEPTGEAPAEAEAAADAGTTPEDTADGEAEAAPEAAEPPEAGADATGAEKTETPVETAAADTAEEKAAPEAKASEQQDDKQADASDSSGEAEAKPSKED